MSEDTPLELAAEFPPVTEDQWHQAVNKVLAGKDTDLSAEELARRFQRQLVTTTHDGIAVQPLYTRDDLPAESLPVGAPGFWPFVRGSTVLGGVQSGWDVRQVLELDPAGQGAEPALDQLERGATSLLIRTAPTEQSNSLTVDRLDAALDGAYLDLITIALDTTLGLTGAEALVGLWQKRQIDPATARGVLGLDPLGTAASQGQALDHDEVERAVALAKDCAAHWPASRAWVVDATRYHEAGASDVEEVACATATGVAYLRLLQDAGLDLTEAFGQLEFRLAATADQFSTMAKLRAARLLWARVADVLGVPDAGDQHQHAITSRRMLTRYDPWTNLLRNTTACFAAGAGGAEAVTVEVHDLLLGSSEQTELGRRLARNTHLLLLEESHLARVIDPGGGSWYIEWLTDAIGRHAWAFLQEIEAAGGMAAALDARVIHERIEQTWQQEMNDLARRKETIVGVSDFPNFEDRIPPHPIEEAAPTGGLPRRRSADAFEALRTRTDDHERTTGHRPSVLLVTLGPASAFTARVTYARAFFETAGLRAVTHEARDAPSADDVRRAVEESGAAVACLCSSDPLYTESGAGALAAVTPSGVVRTYVATRPGALGDTMLAAGADELIYAGCDVLDALVQLLDVLGVK